MKAIFKRPSLHFSGTNSRVKWINDRMTYFLERPVLLLSIPWIFYFAFDLLVTLLFDLDFRGFRFAFITVFTGFSSSLVFFFWLIPGWFMPKKGLLPFFISVSFLGAIVGIKYLLMRFFQISTGSKSEFAIIESLRLFNFLIVTFAVWAFYAFFNTFRDKQKNEIKFEALQLAHKSLQLSPHFLLNVIGDISGKSIQYSPILFEDLNHFTNILRYGYLNTDRFNSLASELDCVLSYLHGQRIRFGQDLYTEVDIARELLDKDDLYMPKMLLLTLTENVFKHGLYQDSQYPVRIQAKMSHTESESPIFTFKTSNKLGGSKTRESSGFGILTVRRLLDFYFQEASLVTNTQEEAFHLTLTIPYAKSHQTWPH